MNLHAPGFNPDDEPWDAYGDEPADPEGYITDKGTCSGCGFVLDFEDLGNFEVEESGVQPGTVDGPAVYWARGYILCPQCGIQLPYEASS